MAGVEVTAPSAKLDVPAVVSEVSLQPVAEVLAQLTHVRDRLVGVDGGLVGGGLGHLATPRLSGPQRSPMGRMTGRDPVRLDEEATMEPVVGESHPKR
jgi:hypothetical protein